MKKAVAFARALSTKDGKPLDRSWADAIAHDEEGIDDLLYRMNRERLDALVKAKHKF